MVIKIVTVSRFMAIIIALEVGNPVAKFAEISYVALCHYDY